MFKKIHWFFLIGMVGLFSSQVSIQGESKAKKEKAEDTKKTINSKVDLLGIDLGIPKNNGKIEQVRVDEQPLLAVGGLKMSLGTKNCEQKTAYVLSVPGQPEWKWASHNYIQAFHAAIKENSYLPFGWGRNQNGLPMVSWEQIYTNPVVKKGKAGDFKDTWAFDYVQAVTNFHVIAEFHVPSFSPSKGIEPATKLFWVKKDGDKIVESTPVSADAGELPEGKETVSIEIPAGAIIMTVCTYHAATSGK